MSETFNAFRGEAFTFFKQLARHNNRDWFQAHREVYEEACREPMKQLVAALGSNPARTKITRINRDMRFVRDRDPYRTHIATVVGDCYLSLSAEGLYVGSGIYMPEGPRLERFRNAIDDNASGPALQQIVGSLRRKGYQVETHERLTASPRGYHADHPRQDLLRMKDIHAGKILSPPVLTTGAAPTRIKPGTTGVSLL